MSNKIYSKEKNTILENNKIIDSDKKSESSIIKSYHSSLPESKLSETTLNNPSDVDLCNETESINNINKKCDTSPLPLKNSPNNIKDLKKKNSNETIINEESNGMKDNEKSISKKGKNIQAPSLDFKKKSKTEKASPISQHKLSKTTKPHAQLTSSSSKLKTEISSPTSKILKNTVNPNSIHSQENKYSNINSNSVNYTFSLSTSSSIPLQKKNSTNNYSINENNKKVSSNKPTNSSRNSLHSYNKSTGSISTLKKSIKPDLRKSITNHNDNIINKQDKNKSYNDYIHNRKDSLLRLKKNSYLQKENIINEKEIVMKSNEYRKAISKINSLEKTIKQLQAQHSETLACLHSEIARLQKACSDKSLAEAFKGTGLLSSLSKKSKSFSSIDSTSDQNLVIKVLNEIPKGINLLPKIPLTRKSSEEINNNIDESKNVNSTVDDKQDNQSNEESITILKRENEISSNSNISPSKKIQINNEIHDNIKTPKKKTSGNIRAHKYHIPTQSYVSLSDASTAVALSSNHSSISSLIKSDIILKDTKNDFINNIKTSSKINRQLPPPVPPNYSKGSNKIESPKRIINLPKILKPISKIKENKNTSISLPSLIKNKTNKNSQRY
ncbi:hypothetical protein BCR32DRAFT_267956 [Anaeromyces robustus]|uniref:CCDC92/74 N-terminal domain-containing protein n=1 Tax=Anaeromyces robustus TaxID=1754192 RepID=A0A1Y1X9H6_9FUNG|nr:hypothetical protein BCR32DRAFT_267956 [Anaeromyces robustus]|eukprot:ORX81984.1 hypothetical protein BCR32DRAFT_267956 [Anaeromyces robustus]